MAEVSPSSGPACDVSDHESCPSQSDEDDDVNEYYYSDDDDIGVIAQLPVHPVLENDIKLLKETGSLASSRSLPDINEMDLDFLFSTSVLERSVAEAWGLMANDPVIIRVSVNQKHYLDCDAVNKVEVFQRSSPKRNGALAQLKNITEEFCRKQFRALTNEIVAKEVEKHQHVSQSLPPKQLMSDMSEMGFTEGDIICAYKMSDGTKESMLSFLLDGPDANYSASGQTRDGRQQPFLGKEIPSLDRGFLVQLYSYIQQRLLTLNNYCPICDTAHHLALTLMLKPVVCNNALCIFSFQTLGVMADAADSISTQSQVVNLLVHLTTAAVNSSRHDTILTPYPTIVHPKRTNEMALHEQNKNHVLLKDILTKMPKIETLLRQSEQEVRELMDRAHDMCYPLLRWIISSNRSHIVQLPPEKQLPFMGTKHQFLMRNSPPLEDRRFRAHQKKHGSIFAFHGSPIENWHSIVREGLIVATGTRKQLNGAAYGKGIYLSPTLQMSMGYSSSRMAPQTNKETYGSKKDKKKKKESVNTDYIQGDSSELTCVTLCEVINNEKLTRHNGSIWTCGDSEYVCTRFFFVYDKTYPTSVIHSHVNMTSDIYVQKVKMALADQMGT